MVSVLPLQKYISRIQHPSSVADCHFSPHHCLETNFTFQYLSPSSCICQATIQSHPSTMPREEQLKNLTNCQSCTIELQCMVAINKLRSETIPAIPIRQRSPMPDGNLEGQGIVPLEFLKVGHQGGQCTHPAKTGNS